MYDVSVMTNDQENCRGGSWLIEYVLTATYIPIVPGAETVCTRSVYKMCSILLDVHLFNYIYLLLARCSWTFISNVPFC